jgi:histidinol-phosphate aminotransferase
MSLAPLHIASIQPYKPGKPMAELERELGLTSTIKLASNENAVGPSPRVFKSLRSRLREINRYPDGSAFELTAALAAKLEVPPECLLLGNGSNELIDIAVRTFLRPGEEVVSARGAFVVYQLATQAAGGENVVVPMRNHTHDLPALAAAVTARTRFVFIANPNNPTGTWVSEREVERFLALIPPGPIVVFDEAYFEYVSRRGFPDVLKRVRAGRPVFCLRTFSKAYGLAGLRIGYLVGPPEYVAEMNKVREPFNTNHLAQIAAVAALGDERHLRKVVRLNRRERDRVAKGCEALGLGVVPSEANFLLVDLSRDGNAVYQELLQRGVIVRPVGNYGYPRCVRITIGLPEENDRLLASLGEVVERVPTDQTP